MADWIEGIVAESVRQYSLNWAAMARSSARGEVLDTELLSCAIAGTTVPLFNLAMAKRPIQTPDAAAAAATEAISEFQQRGIPGVFTAPASWLPPGAPPAIEATGMHYLFSLMGMRTAHLNEPEQATRAEVRLLSAEEAVEPLARVNGVSYGMAEDEWSQLLLPRFWQAGTRAYGVFENGEPVAVGAAATAEGVSYVMWMATLPQARRRGYAAAIMRRAWSDAQKLDGAKFTALHATAMGRPVYAGLGYVGVAEFPTFLWSGH